MSIRQIKDTHRLQGPLSDGSRLLRRKLMSSAFRPAVTRILLASLVLALFFVMPTFLAAQDVAAITGVVTDPSDAVVPGVEVTLTNPQTGVSYKAVTNDLGSYTISQVKPGPGYEIEFKHQSFKSAVV